MVAATRLHPDLHDRLDTRIPPRDLVPFLNALHEKADRVVLNDALAEASTKRDAAQVAQILCRKGWLRQLRTPGAWGWQHVRSHGHESAFIELRAWLALHPESTLCVAGLSAAALRHYLHRQFRIPHLGGSEDECMPDSLSDFNVCRWQPILPCETLYGLPVWRPESLLVYMADCPADFQWEGIPDWLWNLSEDIECGQLLKELKTRPRDIWAKTAYMLDRGRQSSKAEKIFAEAPAGEGPYIWGEREKQWESKNARPIQVPRYDLVDYLFSYWWHEKA